MLSRGLISVAAICVAIVLPSTHASPNFVPQDVGRGDMTALAAQLPEALSVNASISYNISSAPRWSDYSAPQPGAIINVATEDDVAVTVQYCLQYNIPFLAQNGAHGWIDSFDLNDNGVIINLRGLNNTYFNSNVTQARVQGGALISEVITQAYQNNARILTGNCDCVGTLGAGLGGGYGNLLGLYGFSVDNFISINVVLPNGTAVTVTEENEDLWWALRGAGPNFGIVTSAVMKSYPIESSENIAWTGALYYSPDKLEDVMQGIQDLVLLPHMNIFFYFLTSGAPSYTPTFMVVPFYLGNETDARVAFKSILDIGPTNDTTSVLPYDQWNDDSLGFCEKGGRKPSYGVGYMNQVPSTWRQIWNAFLEWLETPGTGDSIILTECYSLDYAQSISPDSSSFPNRDVRFNSVAMPWYYNESLDAAAEAFGSHVRDLLRSVDGLPENRTYVNFAYGDETNDVVYNSSTDRLSTLKKQYDPDNVFNHWFPIQT